MARLKTLLTTLVVFVSVHCAVGQIMPVDITAMAAAPNSNRLSDYYSPSLSKLRVSLLLKDPTEPSWDVYLRVKVQGPWLSFYTSPNYRPAHPLVIHSGEYITVDNSDLEDMLLPSHLITEGAKANLLQQQGLLAEGQYSMEITAYDFKTDKQVSRTVVVPLNVNLNNPPFFVMPQKESVIDVQDIQSVIFQWQDGLGYIQENNSTYCFRLYVVAPEDEGIDGAALLASNRLQKVYEECDLTVKNLILGSSRYVLEVGRKYIATVQVSTDNGTASFKNDGISEPLTFYYGYPENGKIALIEPVQDKHFSLGQHKIFSWAHTDKKLPRQPVVYQMKLAELANDSVSYQQAFNSSDTTKYFGYKQIEVNTDAYGNNNVELSDIKKETTYAWKVEAFTKKQKVGESKVQRFFGPPLVTSFYAKSFKVDVVKSTTKDLKNYSGIGMLYITPSIKVEVKFEHITLDDFGDVFYMSKGEIRSVISLSPKELTPLKVEKNSTAYFNFQEILVEPNAAHVKGYVSWKFPFPTTSGKQDSVITDSKWILYDDYTLLGNIELKNYKNQFELLSPYKHKLRLNPESLFRINGSKYWFEFNGDVVIPNSQNEQNENTVIPFSGVDNLFYIVTKPAGGTSFYRIIPKTNIWLVPRTAVIDLSDDLSPGKFADDKDWKGIYFEDFDLQFDANFDSKKQISLAHDVVVGYNLTDSAKVKAWSITGGVTFQTTSKYPEASLGHFNTFPSDLLSYSINASGGNVSNSWVKGQMLIPFISETKEFAFTVPACNEGLLDGLLDQSLDGYQFTFNPSSEEQKVDITINRAVFVAKERLSMNLSMYWPKMDAHIQNVEGFNAYGNYSIGFFEPNGMATLAEQVQVKFNSYQIIFDLVGAGSSAGAYSFGVSGDIILGSDVSGEAGAPRSNLYSLVPNKYAQEAVVGDRDYKNSLMAEGQEGSFKPQTSSDIDNQVDKLREEKAGIEKDGQDISQKLDDGKEGILASADAMLKELGVTSEDEGDAADSTAVEPQIDSTSNAFLLAQRKEELKTEVIDSLSKSLGFDITNPTLSFENAVKTLEFIATLLPEEKAKKLDSLTVEIRGFFDSEQEIFKGDLQNLNKLVQDYLRDAIMAQVDKGMLVLDQISGQVHAKISDNLKKVLTPVVTNVQDINKRIVNSVAGNFIQLVNSTGASKYVNVNSLITDITVSAVDSLNRKFADYVDQEVVERFAARFSDSLFVQAKNGLRAAILKTVEANLHTIVSDRSLNLDVSSLTGDVDKIIDASVSTISIASVQGDLDEAKRNFFQEFSPDAILSIFEYEFYSKLSDATKLMADLLENQANLLLQQGVDNAIANVTGGALSDLGVNVSMDFNNLGDKLKNGEIDKIIKLDPVYVSIKTSVVSLSGYVNYERDNAVYGDVWLGDFNLEITKPKRIEVSGVYISGKKDGLAYWFCQVEPGTNSGTPTKLGTSLSQEPKVLSDPINLGFVSMVAISGRVYHHMNEQETQIVPDQNTAYGAYLNMTFFDNQKAGSVLRLAFKTTFVINENDDYRIDLNGNLQVGSVSFSETKPDPYAPIQGLVSFSFNSAEDHFIGGGDVTINKPGVLCAHATIWADIKPGFWSLAVGNRDNRFVFVPACGGWSPTGWLAISKTRADIGLGLMYSIAAKFGLSAGRVSLQFLLDAGIAAGLEAVVGLKPFVVEQVGIWVDLWAKLIVQYKIKFWRFKKSGAFTLVDALFKGDLIARFKPTEIEGRISGKIKFLSIIKMGFNASVKYAL